MTLHKWRMSSTELLVSIPEELRETSALNITPSPGEYGKALGIHWNTDKDCLYVDTPDLSSAQPASKQSVSSIIAKTFDVLGWYSLAILPAKLLLQELWSMKVTWDDPLPEALQQRWQLWLNKIPNITQHTVPRHAGKSSSQVHSRSWHGFCDASSRVYGGAVYLRIVHTDTTISIDLIMAKSKVAPIKAQTIPRLEQCGA